MPGAASPSRTWPRFVLGPRRGEDTGRRPFDKAFHFLAPRILRQVEALSKGRVDLTFGSALDIFGGTGVKYSDCVAWNKSK